MGSCSSASLRIYISSTTTDAHRIYEHLAGSSWSSVPANDRTVAGLLVEGSKATKSKDQSNAAEHCTTKKLCTCAAKASS